MHMQLPFLPKPPRPPEQLNLRQQIAQITYSVLVSVALELSLFPALTFHTHPGLQKFMRILHFSFELIQWFREFFKVQNKLLVPRFQSEEARYILAFRGVGWGEMT